MGKPTLESLQEQLAVQQEKHVRIVDKLKKLNDADKVCAETIQSLNEQIAKEKAKIPVGK